MTETAPAAAQSWRPLRRTLHLGVRIREQRSCPLAVTMIELSTIDCRIWAGFRLAEARDATLLLPGLEAVRVRVMWSRDWEAELVFERALHPAIVDHLVTVGVVPIPEKDR